MKASLTRALQLIRQHEGGYVNHPRDPGGCTNLGITLATLRAHGRPHATCADIKRLGWEAAADIYRATYWGDCHGDDLPAGVDLAVFDMAVNAGPHRAVVLLQRLLGVTPDGRAGPRTCAAAAAAPAPRLIKDYAAARLDFYRHLDTWPTFGKGWAARVQATTHAALQLATEPLCPAPS